MPQNKELAPIRVIARRSKLSQLQVAEVFNRLKDIPYTIVFTDTFGDKKTGFVFTQR